MLHLSSLKGEPGNEHVRRVWGSFNYISRGSILCFAVWAVPKHLPASHCGSVSIRVSCGSTKTPAFPSHLASWDCLHSLPAVTKLGMTQVHTDIPLCRFNDPYTGPSSELVIE